MSSIYQSPYHVAPAPVCPVALAPLYAVAKAPVCLAVKVSPSVRLYDSPEWKDNKKTYEHYSELVYTFFQNIKQGSNDQNIEQGSNPSNPFPNLTEFFLKAVYGKEALSKPFGYFARLFSDETWTEWNEQRTPLGQIESAFNKYITTPTHERSCFDKDVIQKAEDQASKVLKALKDLSSSQELHRAAGEEGLPFWSIRSLAERLFKKIEASFAKTFPMAAASPVAKQMPLVDASQIPVTKEPLRPKEDILIRPKEDILNYSIVLKSFIEMIEIPYYENGISFIQNLLNNDFAESDSKLSQETVEHLCNEDRAIAISLFDKLEMLAGKAVNGIHLIGRDTCLEAVNGIPLIERDICLDYKKLIEFMINRIPESMQKAVERQANRYIDSYRKRNDFFKQSGKVTLITFLGQQLDIMKYYLKDAQENLKQI